MGDRGTSLERWWQNLLQDGLWLGGVQGGLRKQGFALDWALSESRAIL